MKKLSLILLTVLCSAILATAQTSFRPEGTSLSTEVYYTPIAGGDSSINKLSAPEYGVKFRFFLNENYVIKLNLGFQTSGKKVNQIYDVNNTSYYSYSKNAHTVFSLTPGFEYHFNKFDRVFPYVGAEIGFSVGSNKNKTWNTQNSDYSSSKTPIIGFGIGATTGVDVYLCKGLYAGLELGLGYRLNVNGQGEAISSVGGTVTTVYGDITTSDSSFGFYVVPSIRIGWHF